jgi:sugar phosphate isomerase/epimerase
MEEPKIGLSTLYCLGEPFDKMLKHIMKTKTKNIEIVDEGYHTLNKKRITTLKDLRESYSLKFSVHAPFADINIASPSQHMLKAMLKRLKQSIMLTRELEAYMWIFHPGLKTGISMFYPKKDWVQNGKTIQLLYKIAKNYGVEIALENVPEPYPFLMKSVEHFKRFYKEVRDEIGLALDIGHANLNKQIELFLETFPDKIVHIHVHDNNGVEDQHLGIGYGTVNWEKIAKRLKKISYNRTVVVESIEHVYESLRKLKTLLF